MAAERKTVLFIVEGKSDKTALEHIFKKIYKGNKEIEFRFTDGDISSDEAVTVRDACDRIYKIVEKFTKDKKLNKKDIWQIIHIFDTDGTYIPKDAVILGDTTHFVYSPQNISCKYINRVLDRNERKNGIMDFLLTQKEIKTIPYEMYYMSCNLDHALYNIQNLPEEQKMLYADAFYERFVGNEKKFIDFLKTDVVNGVPNSFPESWRYIKKDLHSLERHTNLHLYFEKYPLPQGF